MIVKNEADLLPGCLESISDLADEIIVVDTGSTDNTVKIALNYGAKVYHEIWQNHFGKARNRSLEQARGQWVLILDADERFPLEFKNRLIPLLYRAILRKTEGIIVKIKSYYGKDIGYNYVFDSACRIFRNRPEYRFKLSLHEEMSHIILKKNPKARIETTDIYIEHFGYVEKIIHQKRKNERNLNILKRELENNPHDPFLNYACGTEYFQQQQYQLALDYYRKALKVDLKTLSFGADLIYKMAVSYLHLREYKKGLMTVERGLKIFPDFTALWFIKGELHYLQGQLEIARSAYQKCLEIRSDPRRYIQINGLESFRTYWALGRTFEKEGNEEKAVEFYCLAYQNNHQYQSAYEGILRIFKSQKNRILNYLDFSSINSNYDPVFDLYKTWLSGGETYEQN